VEQGDFGGQYETGMSSRGAAALRDFGRPMSAQGQSRRFGDVRPTSALLPKTDIHRKGRQACLKGANNGSRAHSITLSARPRASLRQPGFSQALFEPGEVFRSLNVR
jgi:hypothetical protein